MLIDLKFNIDPAKVNLKFNAYQRVVATDESVDRYKGDYEVTPKVESQVLQTAQKFLEDNVTIKEIPYFDVSNTAGGSTVYIGNEVV